MSRFSSTLRALLLAGTTAIALTTAAAEDPARLAEQARRNAAAISLEVNPALSDDPDRARRVAEAGAARGREALESQAAARRARTEVSISIDAQGRQAAARPAAEAAPAAQPILAGRLLVAISTSMPEAMVRAYARQLDGIPEAILVLRGFIGGARAVKPTVEWIERALRKHPGDPDGGHFRVEVVVDPIAYRMLGIEQVPAVLFLPGVQDLRHCDAETLRASGIAYGAVSVHGALTALGRTLALPAPLLARLKGRS